MYTNMDKTTEVYKTIALIESDVRNALKETLSTSPKWKFYNGNFCKQMSFFTCFYLSLFHPEFKWQIRSKIFKQDDGQKYNHGFVMSQEKAYFFVDLEREPFWQNSALVLHPLDYMGFTFGTPVFSKDGEQLWHDIIGNDIDHQEWENLFYDFLGKNSEFYTLISSIELIDRVNKRLRKKYDWGRILKGTDELYKICIEIEEETLEFELQKKRVLNGKLFDTLSYIFDNKYKRSLKDSLGKIKIINIERID